MAEVFISYSVSNRPQAQMLVDALRADGFAVWWDQDIPMEADWPEAIAAALAAAKAVVVCWSSASVVRPNVREEARRARARGLLLQVYLEECEPPLFFGEQQGARLIGWSGNRENDRYQLLAQGLRALLAGKQPPKALSREIGFKPRSNLFVPLAITGLGILAAAAAAILWIPDVRDRLFPRPPTIWTMQASVNADLRPAFPPTAGFMERNNAPTLIAIAPEFTPDRAVESPASVSDARLILEMPGEQPVEFRWHYFTAHDDDPSNYLDKLGNAGPFALTEAGGREITFQPASTYRWIDFVFALSNAFSSNERYFVLRVRTTIVADGAEPTMLESECRLPIAPILEQIQNEQSELRWVTLPCGMPAPDISAQDVPEEGELD